MEKFRITFIEDNQYEFKEVKGERVFLDDLECFVFEEKQLTDQGPVIYYNVTHLETGLNMSHEPVKQVAILKAEIRYRYSPDDIIQGRNFCKLLGIPLPVNIPKAKING